MRKKQLSILLAVLGIAGLLGILGLRLWASSARNDMPQLSMVHTGTDGHVYVLLADTVYVEDDEGTSLGLTPLSKFGLHDFWGDFVALSDGSLILPSAPQPGDTAQKEADIYARRPVTASQEDAEGVPLTHCYPASGECELLKGSGGKYFKADRTFKLAVDERAGRIYVADTAGQRLLILDMQGGILAQKTDGFSFPNQLTLTPKGTLLVTDNNNHRLLEFTVSGDQFDSEPDPTPMQSWPSGRLHDFPTGVAQDTDGTRWTVLADGDIRHGELYRVAPDSKQGKLVPTPAGDALYVSIGDADALIPDMQTYRIYRFSRDGSVMPDFGSPQLLQKLDSLGRERAIYDAIFRYSLAAMFAMLLMLVLAQHVSKLVDTETEADVAPALVAASQPFVPPPTGSVTLSWQGSDIQFRRRMTGLGKGSRRFAYAIFLLPAVLLVGLVFLLPVAPPHTAHVLARSQRLDTDLVVIALLFVILIVYIAFSYGFERLIVTRTGIRYRTWLAGPLAMLAPFYPSWSVEWAQLQAIRLAPRAGGTLAMQWFYELESQDGSIRRVGALFWRRIDQEDDTGLTIRMGRKRDPQLLFQVITRTALYRLMSDARKSVDARNAPSVPAT